MKYLLFVYKLLYPIHSSRDVFMTSYIHVVFSVCLQLVEDVKAVDGHQPHRRLRKKVHHRLLLRPNQPGRLSRSEARYKHGIVCDFIILFSWNNHDVFTKFSILFPVLYVFRLFFLTAKYMRVRWRKKHLLFLLKTRENGRKKIHSVLENYFPHPYVWKWNLFGLFLIMLAHSGFFCLLLYYYYN